VPQDEPERRSGLKSRRNDKMVVPGSRAETIYGTKVLVTAENVLGTTLLPLPHTQAKRI